MEGASSDSQPAKPKSRLLAMKARLRSQRSKNTAADNASASLAQRHSQSFTANVTSQSHSAQPPVTSQSFSEVPASKKKLGFFSGFRHSKSKSVELVLNDNPNIVNTMDTLSKKEKKKLAKQEKKSKSEEKRFGKLSKSRSFDRLNDENLQPDTKHQLNKSLDSEKIRQMNMDDSTCETINETSIYSNKSQEEPEVKYQILRKLPTDNRFMDRTRSSRTRSPSLEYTLRRKILRSEGESGSQNSGGSRTSDVRKRNTVAGAYGGGGQKYGRSVSASSRDSNPRNSNNNSSSPGSPPVFSEVSETRAQLTLGRGNKPHTVRTQTLDRGRPRDSRAEQGNTRLPVYKTNQSQIPTTRTYQHTNANSAKLCGTNSIARLGVSRTKSDTYQLERVPKTTQPRSLSTSTYQSQATAKQSFQQSNQSNQNTFYGHFPPKITRVVHENDATDESQIVPCVVEQRSGLATSRDNCEANRNKPVSVVTQKQSSQIPSSYIGAYNVRLTQSLRTSDYPSALPQTKPTRPQYAGSVNAPTRSNVQNKSHHPCTSSFGYNRSSAATPPNLLEYDSNRVGSSTSLNSNERHFGDHFYKNDAQNRHSVAVPKRHEILPSGQIIKPARSMENLVYDTQANPEHPQSNSTRGSLDKLNHAAFGRKNISNSKAGITKDRLNNNDNLYRRGGDGSSHYREGYQATYSSFAPQKAHNTAQNEPNIVQRSVAQRTKSADNALENYEYRIEDLKNEFRHLLRRRIQQKETNNEQPQKDTPVNEYEGFYHVKKDLDSSSEVETKNEVRSLSGPTTQTVDVVSYPSDDNTRTSSKHDPEAHVQHAGSRLDNDAVTSLGDRPMGDGQAAPQRGHKPPLPPRSASLRRYVSASSTSSAERPPIPEKSVAGTKTQNGGLKVVSGGGKLKLRRPPVPRRHTVTVGATVNTEKEKFAEKNKGFIEHLANKFPEHAHTITGKTQEQLQQTPTDARHAAALRERNESYYEAIGEADCSPNADPNFHRGGRLRASLPIVKSPNRSLEKPLGLVFLVHQNETKRALLPNEVTSADTVRALFARAFAPQVTLQWFERMRAKVYIQDPATQLYYELEDLRDVKDRSVLKIVTHEGVYGTHGPPRSPHIPAALSPRVQSQAGYDSDTSIRSAPAVPSHYDRPKACTLQGQYACPQQLSNYAAPQPWPSPKPYHPASRSPHELSNRHSVGYHIGSAPVNEDVYAPGMPHSASYHDYGDQRPASGTATPIDDPQTRERMERMEAQLASLTVMVQHAVVPPRGGSRPGSAYSSKAASESAGSDSTTPTLQSPSADSYQGGSELSGQTTPVPVSPQLVCSLKQLRERARQLRADTSCIRQLTTAHMHATKENINQTFLNIKAMLERIPGARDLPVRAERLQADTDLHDYQQHARAISTDITDLACSVDELRQDVLERGCRVNREEVQTMALALGNISKQLAHLKARFPELQGRMKTVMAGEMEIVVQEEKFLREQPIAFEEQLKKCEQIMKTLKTLKRLATVQEKQPPRQPTLGSEEQIGADSPRTCVLSNIQALVPDHSQRLVSLQEASAARERKKKIVVQAESLRFEKSLELAQKQLKNTQPDTAQPPTSLDLSTSPSHSTSQPQTSHAMSMSQSNQSSISSENQARIAEDATSPTLPLTDTTRRISEVSQDGGDSGEVQVPEGVVSNARAPQKPPRLFSAAESVPTVVPIHTQAPPSSLSPSHAARDVTDAASHNTSHNASQNTSHNASRLSTFGADLMTSTPNGPPKNMTSGAQISVTSLQSVESEKRGVSFNDSNMSHNLADVSATSVKDRGVKEGTKAKKIPPPPPPRKSSRVTSKSVTSNSALANSNERDSPPTYENIHKFSNPSNKDSGATSPVKSPSRIARPVTNRRLTKFEQDIASGACSNANRPDLQEQRLCGAEMVRTHMQPSNQPSDPPNNESNNHANSKAKPGTGRVLSAVYESGHTSDDSDSSGHSQDTVKRLHNKPNNLPNNQPQSQPYPQLLPYTHPPSQPNVDSNSQSGREPNTAIRSLTQPSKLPMQAKAKSKVGGANGKGLANGKGAVVDVSKAGSRHSPQYSETEIY